VEALAQPLIAIVGPTASGKSALALRLAEAMGGEIVSCDSLQVYRGLDIGSAKAGAEERRRVPHHLLDVVDPDQHFSAADYARLGRAALADITGRGRRPIVAGGTGLYLRALLSGLFEGPSRDPALRQRLERMARRFGDARLHRLLARVDPAAAARTAPRDRVRVIRALEVYWQSGRPITDHQREPLRPLEGYVPLLVGLDPPRPALLAAVERRTDEMLARGLLEETRALLARYPPGLRPLQAIGYRQAVAVLQGRLDPAQARRDMVKDTMRYAKRQLTWFRHQAQVHWFSHADAALEFVTERMKHRDTETQR
jgi:tRNA dimethylallyltransferase